MVDPGAFTPPTDPLKSVSPVKTSVSLTTKLSIPSVWPGRVEGVDAQPAGLEHLHARLDRPVHVQQPLGLQRVGQDLHAELLLVDVVLGHVVGVVVGQQQVRRRDAVSSILPRAAVRTGRRSR